MAATDLVPPTVAIAVTFGVIGLTLVVLQYIRNRRRGNLQATKFFILGLVVIPVLMIPVWMYAGQILRVATTP